MNNAQRAESILRQANAILDNDHFVSVNGYHSAGWIDKDSINPHASLASELCKMIAEETADLSPEIICGPAQGGLIVALWTGFHACLPAVFVEHDPAQRNELRGKFVFRRGYDRWVTGKRVLVVDDVVNTGYSVLQTIDAVNQAGGSTVGIACYLDRGNVTSADLGDLNYRYLLQWKIPSWPEEQTPEEILSRPVNTRYAHGAEYLARKAACKD